MVLTKFYFGVHNILMWQFDGIIWNMALFLSSKGSFKQMQKKYILIR